ncbi:hypothetical protein [Halorientalis marina]|jgi:hypothetical protein|uniref:hypothetical protein n=1 Tax=Halorientalis marina TaxID=2931976 RepID=UPI001FF6CF44|nr:hypothetical protein [Halorientalis marina]
MCHGIPPGQLLLRDEIAEALLDAGDERGDTDGTAAFEATADAEADAETMSHLVEEAADAQVLTGAMSAEDPFENDRSSPR